MNSAYYLSMMNKYESVKKQVSALYSYLGNCASLIEECVPVVGEIIFDGEPIDKGMLNDMSSKLEQLKGAFNTVIGECELKIATYEALYYTALKNEKESNGSPSATV